MRNSALVGALMALAAVTFPGPVYAHAKLEAAQPAIGGTVAAVPSELALTFNEELNLKFTGVKVTGPDNGEVQTSGARLMDGDKTFRVSLPAGLATGTYKVEWHALSRDGHKTHGEYTFAVKP